MVAPAATMAIAAIAMSASQANRRSVDGFEVSLMERPRYPWEVGSNRRCRLR